MGRPFTGKKSVATFEEKKANGTIYTYYSYYTPIMIVLKTI